MKAKRIFRANNKTAAERLRERKNRNSKVPQLNFRRLLDHSRIGSAQADIGEAVLSYPVGEHRIFYEALPGRIYVVRVLHKAMDVERHL